MKKNYIKKLFPVLILAVNKRLAKIHDSQKMDIVEN